MSYDEEEEVKDGFDVEGDDEEPLDMPEDIDLGDDDDPDNRYH